jgi:phosphatidylinositol glycan class Q protein
MIYHRLLPLAFVLNQDALNLMMLRFPLIVPWKISCTPCTVVLYTAENEMRYNMIITWSFYFMPPSSTTGRTTRSVFWPDNCTKGRVCYGWMLPTICVAGVLQVSVHYFPMSCISHFILIQGWLYEQDSLTNAGDALLSEALSNSSDLWNPVKKSCGGNDPILLGTCEFDDNSPIPSSLTLWNTVEEDKDILVEPIFVLYHACSPNSLRFYTLLPLEVTSGTPRPRDFYSELAQYDFTRPQRKNIDQALNEVVINQVCIQLFSPLEIV